MKLKPIIIALIIITGVIIGIRLVSGEDNWICDKGEWVMHGKPSAPRPVTPCPVYNK